MCIKWEKWLNGFGIEPVWIDCRTEALLAVRAWLVWIGSDSWPLTVGRGCRSEV